MEIIKIIKYSLIVLLTINCIRATILEPSTAIGSILGSIAAYVIIRFIYHIFNPKKEKEVKDKDGEE